MNYPTTLEPSGITITSISPTLVSLTHSLKRQVRRRGGQRWIIDVQYPLSSREEFAPIWAFKIGQQGQFKTFTYIPHIYGSTSGDAVSTLSVDGNHNAGDSTIACEFSVDNTPALIDEYPLVDDWGLTDNEVFSTTGILKEGDFIKFANHTKVYMVITASATTLTIEPSLHSDIVDREEVVYNNVPFTMAFIDDTTSMKVSVNAKIAHNIKLVEIV